MSHSRVTQDRSAGDAVQFCRGWSGPCLAEADYASPTSIPHRKATEADERRLPPSAFSMRRTTPGVLSRVTDVASNHFLDGGGTKGAFPGAASEDGARY